MLLLPLWQILLFLCWQNVPALGTSPGHILFPSSVTGALFLFHQLSYLFICLFIRSQFLFLSSPWRKPCFCGGSLHCQPMPCRQVVRRDCWYQNSPLSVFHCCAAAVVIVAFAASQLELFRSRCGTRWQSVFAAYTSESFRSDSPCCCWGFSAPPSMPPTQCTSSAFGCLCQLLFLPLVGSSALRLSVCSLGWGLH